jgi:flagellar hook-associated protein 2
MATVNLGNVVDGRFVGINSNLDTEALVDELAQVQKIPIDNLNDDIEVNQSKITEFANLRTLTNDLKSASEFLKNPLGADGLNRFANIFDYRISSLSSSTISNIGQYLSVEATPGALTGNTEIEIGNIAKSLELRSGSFNSRNTDATNTATGSYFSAGTFQIGSGVTNSVNGDTLTGFELADADYSVEGSASGVLTASGINNITVTGASGGLESLQGSVSGFIGNYDSGELTLTVNINGTQFTSNAITANSSINAGANTGIDSSTDAVITFTADSGGDNETSFDIELNQDIVIDEDEANVISFLGDLESALSNQSIYQSRRIENFTDANVKSPLTGLTNEDIRFVSNGFNLNNGTFGQIENITVVESSGSNGVISVDIGSETYRAIGLGTTLNSNLVLQSTSSDKQLEINLGDAGVSLDISDSANAVAVEKSLGYAFGTRELIDFDVSSGDTLNDIAFAFNQLSSDTGLSASVVQVSAADFRLSLKATNEGTRNSTEFFDDSGILTNASISTIQAAEDAVFSVDGVEVTRSSNSISDVIQDVTFNLLQATPGYGGGSAETIDLSISNDTETVFNVIVDFIDSYNALRVYNSQQNQRDEATSNFVEDAILGGDTTLSTLVDQISNFAFSTIGGASSANFDALTDLGISAQDFEGDSETIATSNILVYDEETLKSALNNNFERVREVFEFQFEASSNDIDIIATSNSASLSNFQLDIDFSRGTGQEVQLLDGNGDAVLDGSGNNVYLEYNGGNIRAQAGTDIAGFEFIYVGSGSETIEISYTQGVADRIFNLTDSYTEDDGVLDTRIEDLRDQNEDYERDIGNLQVRLDSYVERLRLQFSELESALSNVNSILTFLEADSAARENN